MGFGKEISGGSALAILGIGLVTTIAIAAILISNTLIIDTDVSNPDKGVNVSKVQCTLDQYEELGGPVTVGVPYELGIRLESAGDYDGVRVYFEIAGIDITADDVVVRYYDGTEWLSLPMTQKDVDTLSGWFGPSSGFHVPYGYDATTPLCVTFYEVGHYTTSVSAHQI